MKVKEKYYAYGGSALKRKGLGHLAKPFYINMELRGILQSQNSAGVWILIWVLPGWPADLSAPYLPQTRPTGPLQES